MARQRVVVAGGSGFIGRRLTSELVETGREVVLLTRSPNMASNHSANPSYVMWNGRDLGDWKTEVDGAYAVINLAGEPIAQTCTSEARQRILTSRVESTLAIAEAIRTAHNPPPRWINASAIGYYGSPETDVAGVANGAGGANGSNSVDESAGPGVGFLAETCVAWERAVTQTELATTQKSILRIGIVLGSQGMLPPLVRLARLGVGGKIGTGRQMVSWIHVDDLVGSMLWLLEQARPPRVVNGTAPNPVTNQEFMAALRRLVRAPFGLPTPAALVRLTGKLGAPDGDLILSGVRALPTALVDQGYRFRFPDLNRALQNILAA